MVDTDPTAPPAELKLASVVCHVPSYAEPFHVSLTRSEPFPNCWSVSAPK